MNLSGAGKSILISRLSVGYLSGLLRLIGEIPNEYFTISGQDYTNLILSIECIDSGIKRWYTDGSVQNLFPHNEQSLIELIYGALKKCPDMLPVPSTTELPFIDDENMRTNIRIDLSSATRSLHNGEWKAATVLAGSVCEALLFWAIPKAKDYNPANIKNSQGKNRRLDQLDLGAFINYGVDLKIITTGTRDIAQRARNYRNLIHPGRAQRAEQECDRSSAMTALAAAECIIKNLKMASEAPGGWELSKKQLDDDKSQYVSD
ncbi:hypothetical protein WSS15_14710 [Acetobacter pasteurianus]|nr:hypothetical protein WSS15_14710 [Acetobacter pasteurianus]